MLCTPRAAHISHLGFVRSARISCSSLLKVLSAAGNARARLSLCVLAPCHRPPSLNVFSRGLTVILVARCSVGRHYTTVGRILAWPPGMPPATATEIVYLALIMFGVGFVIGKGGRVFQFVCSLMSEWLRNAIGVGATSLRSATPLPPLDAAARCKRALEEAKRRVRLIEHLNQVGYTLPALKAFTTQWTEACRKLRELDPEYRGIGDAEIFRMLMEGSHDVYSRRD